MNDQAKWTFMVYLAGDNNLSTAGDKDLLEMRSIGSNDDVNIVVEFDNAGKLGTHRILIRSDGKDETPVSLGETDSGDPNTLLDFISWAHKHHPAERYALILWNHGGGWEPSAIDQIAQDVGARDFNVREASERSSSPLGRTFFRTSLKTIFSLPTPNERAICSDDGSGHSLDTVELGRVLEKMVEILGKPVDLLGMDACLMSNLEVAYQARPFARYIVASEESEPNDGWPYDAVLRRLVRDPDLETADLASEIVYAYIDSYVSRSYSGPVTQSAMDLSKIDSLTGPLDRLARALIDHMPAAAMEIWTAQRGSVRFWHNTLWDIAHFCEELEKGTANDAVRTAAADVRAALQPGAGNFVLAEAHNGDSVARVGGVTVYLLPPLMDISRYYADLDFVKNHRWLEMMQAYHSM